jgi:dolichol-phosphate mannosyltransferase
MITKVTSVIIIPSYNETLALPELLAEISSSLTPKDAVIIMDDSASDISKIIEDKCQKSIEGSLFNFHFDNSGSKSGRGAAIRRGMIKALNDFPEAMFIVECDADGSHRAIDILKIKDSENNADLLIGSRYLPSSEIIGWPMSRRIFSWILNNTIPRVTSVDVDDITNGLRRYSREAVRQILSTPQINTGFVYLSEQAVVLAKRGMKISEEPIIFVDRTLGKSTVTWREITNSLLGIMKLVLTRQKI